jgi:hypothetical protein
MIRNYAETVCRLATYSLYTLKILNWNRPLGLILDVDEDE